MTKAHTHERGQAMVFTVIFLTVLLALAAAVLDVGSWYRADRKLQANVDAAALAGAQALPDSSGEARSLALEYADKNDGGVVSEGISFESANGANDTIVVKGSRPAPSFFAKLFGLDSVTVGAVAKARASAPSAARWVAPIVVDEKHPLLRPTPTSVPRFNEFTSIHLVDLHRPGSGNASGSFGLINLDSQNASGDVGSATMGEWVRTGYEGYMELGNYRSVPSAEFNSLHLKDALDAKIGEELLFPIYRSIIGSGQGAQFEVVGWVGFLLQGFQIGGSRGRLDGEFVRVIWEGVGSGSGSSDPAYGVRVIHLVE